jgi:energy-coupling factor transporter ATP-binding protein EcfA2
MVSPIDIQKALSGIDYPASKGDIVGHAEQHGAGKDVLDALNGIEDREYDGPSGVSAAVFD